MKWTGRRLAAMALVTLLVALTGGLLVRMPALQVVFITVSGKTGVKERLGEWLRKHALGRPLVTTWPPTLHAGIVHAFPELSDVHVRFVLPDRLVVHARARRALALARAGGSWWFVDKHGAWPGRDDADLPLLRAPRRHWHEGAQLVALLEKHAPARAAALSEVRLVTGWRLVFAQGELWLLGREQAPARLEAVLAWLTRQGLTVPVRLDASLPDRWFVRPARLLEVEG